MNHLNIQTIVLALLAIGNLLALVRTSNLNKRLLLAEAKLNGLMPGIKHTVRTIGGNEPPKGRAA